MRNIGRSRLSQKSHPKNNGDSYLTWMIWSVTFMFLINNTDLSDVNTAVEMDQQTRNNLKTFIHGIQSTVTDSTYEGMYCHFSITNLFNLSTYEWNYSTDTFALFKSLLVNIGKWLFSSFEKNLGWNFRSESCLKTI